MIFILNKSDLRGDTVHFLTVFSYFDFGVAMMFMKHVLNTNCYDYHVEQFSVDSLALRRLGRLW